MVRGLNKRRAHVKLNKNYFIMVIDLLIGHSSLNRHLNIVGKEIYDPSCNRCGEIELSSKLLKKWLGYELIRLKIRCGIDIKVLQSIDMETFARATNRLVP